MIVPSRSRKTAGHFSLGAIALETGDQFVARHGGGAEFADDDGAGVVGNFRRFQGRRAADQCEREEGDRRIACTGNVEDLTSFGRNMMRWSVLLKEHHAMFAECDENALCAPL